MISAISARLNGSNAVSICAPCRNCWAIVPLQPPCDMRISRPITRPATLWKRNGWRPQNSQAKNRPNAKPTKSSTKLGRGKSCSFNARDGGRTRTPLAGLRILSPVRLPVPPPRRFLFSTTYRDTHFRPFYVAYGNSPFPGPPVAVLQSRAAMRDSAQTSRNAPSF